jgi:hypothetical protein
VPDAAAFRSVCVDQAVGLALAHDLTEVRDDGGKGAAFRRGHVIRDEDLPRTRRRSPRVKDPSVTSTASPPLSSAM